MQDSDVFRNVLTEMSVLYELSLRIGQSLDLKTNCDHFLKVLMARKNLAYASVWIKREYILADADEHLLPACRECEFSKIQEQPCMVLVYANPEFRTRERCVPLQHPMCVGLTEKDAFSIASSDTGFADIVTEKRIDTGAFAILALGNLGVLKLFSKTRTTPFHPEELNQFRSLADKFTVSLEACLEHLRVTQEVAARQQAETDLRKQRNELDERVKELHCLYGISDLVEQADLSFEALLQKIVNLLPVSWQYPKATCARITIEERQFSTAGFCESPWKLASLILVHDRQVGKVEVCYRDEKPLRDEGPFLAEERHLIDAIAGRLGRIVDHKRTEETLDNYRKHLEQMVEERTRELKEAQEELVRKAIEAGWAQLAAMVLHNIGNAITPINIYVEGMQDGTLAQLADYLGKCYHGLTEHADDIQHYVNDDQEGRQIFSYFGKLIHALTEYAKKQAETVDKIDGAIVYITEILTLQQTYAANEQERKERVDVNRLLEDAVRVQTGALQRRAITVEKQLDPTISKIIIDKNRLMQVVVNFIKNSYEAIDELKNVERKRVLSFTSFEQNGEVVFEITDTGIGIGPEAIDTIFEFGNSGKGSSGFGLYYCKMFIEGNGGNLSITSPGRGKGATVSVSFQM